MDKLKFKYQNTDGKIETNIKKYPDRMRIESVERNFYKGVAFVEREWRNAEFVATDYMLLPQARYQGELLADSQKLQDIFDYRNALHEYDVESKDARPKRPGWFKETERN